MRVLLLTTHLEIGGVTMYTVNLARGLKLRNIPVFIASSGGELAKTLEKEKIPQLFLNIKTKFEFNPKLFFAFLKLLIFIKRNDISVIHAQTRVAQVLAYFLSAVSGASYVSTCHGFFRKDRISRRIFGAWGNYCIAISDAVREHLIKDFKVREDRAFLIYNGVDVGKFSAVVDKKQKESLKDDLGFAKSPIIGSVSRLSPVKGLRYLLFAMKDILKEDPSLHLLLVGEGPSKDYLVELAKKLGIEKNVFFAMSTTETERFLSIIDVFVFYSLEEGLGLSLLEAMAAGKPCVASAVGGVASIIEDGVTGILVTPKHTHALKEAIMKIISAPELKRSLALNASALVKNKFSLDRMLDEVINVYEKAGKRGQTPFGYPKGV